MLENFRLYGIGEKTTIETMKILCGQLNAWFTTCRCFDQMLWLFSGQKVVSIQLYSYCN